MEVWKWHFHTSILPHVHARCIGDYVSTIRVLLADDQALFREGLHTLLSLQPDLEVVGEAENGAEVLRLAAALRPDVVLMDVQMPQLDGVAATRRLRAEQPECRVIML